MRPRKESFWVEPTKLNLKACPFEDYPEAPKTEQLEEALEYIQEMDASTSPPTS